jgi:hypothetical protein
MQVIFYYENTDKFPRNLGLLWIVLTSKMITGIII